MFKFVNKCGYVISDMNKRKLIDCVQRAVLHYKTIMQITTSTVRVVSARIIVELSVLQENWILRETMATTSTARRNLWIQWLEEKLIEWGRLHSSHQRNWGDIYKYLEKKTTAT